MKKQEPAQAEQKPSNKKSDPASKAAPQATSRTSAVGLLALFLVLVLAAGGGVGGYYLWQQQENMQGQMRSQQKAQKLDSQQLQQQMKQVQGETAQLIQSIEANTALIQQLETSQQQISDISQRAIEQTNRGQRDWILAEIDYLLRLANRRLEIARDINSAAAALQAADQRIHELGDLNLLPIRKQLARDIAALKALHQVDVNGTALALDQMIILASALPFKSVQEEIKAQMQTEATATTEKKPESFVDSVISTVKNIGDIKVHHRSIQPASSAQQQQQIEQILRTHLLAARLAVLRFDQLQFSHDIEQAQKVLHLHYQDTDNRVKQMQKDLAQFSSINLTPDLPSITTSWNMLQEKINAVAKPAKSKPAAPAKPKEKPTAQQAPANDDKPAIDSAPANKDTPAVNNDGNKPAEVL